MFLEGEAEGGELNIEFRFSALYTLEMRNNMIKIKGLIACLGLWLVCVSPVAAQPWDPAATQLWNDIDAALERECNDTARVGLKIFSLDRNETLIAQNSNNLFTPASNMKIITSVMALKRVGTDYRFYTRLYSHGTIEDGVLKGDLYIKGFGDPYLVSEQMWILVNELKNLPIHKIEGDIIADNRYFDNQRRLATWANYSGPEAYLAPMGALSFNFNTVTVHVEPAKEVGDPPIVVVDPAIGYFSIRNTAKTVANRKKHRRLIVNRLPRGEQDEIIVSGTIPKTMARKKYYLNITDPQKYTLSAFHHYLNQAGVEVTGNARAGQIPEKAPVLVEHQSPPLSEILRGLNKFSNNFIAEQILRTLGAEAYGTPGTTGNGVRLMHRYMKSLGYEDDRFRILDGSGLTRGNLLSPDQIVDVLKDAYNDMSVYPEFVSALGVMGVDGSVEDRMSDRQEARKVRAKTGTLNHVSALSGYFQSRDGERFAFSFLLNDLKCSNGKAMALEDEILGLALQFTRQSGMTESKGMDAR